jgi:hypothetical protein
MSPNLFEPRRLRESPERPNSIEGRLARQLRILSVYTPTPQLRRYSTLPRRRRYILTTVRVVAVATIVLGRVGSGHCHGRLRRSPGLARPCCDRSRAEPAGIGDSKASREGWGTLASEPSRCSPARARRRCRGHERQRRTSVLRPSSVAATAQVAGTRRKTPGQCGNAAAWAT